MNKNSKKYVNHKGKTRKNRGIPQKFEQQIVLKFIIMLNTVKLYHWKTHSYATHKATDKLYDDLNDHIDKFVETLLGKSGDRVNLTGVKSIPLKDYTSVEQLKREVNDFKGYLVSLNNNPALKSMSNSDLYNIRDEILGDINQFLYLLTFNK
uniref:Ferritin/DPS protein domain-containing protein n=1 Tax=viral metagenome TaxID=1070528 RepID=A0A6C0KXF8_9ZZZZ